MKQPNEFTDIELLRHVNQCSGEVWVDFHPVPCPLCKEYERRNLNPQLPCICEGNWRKIIKGCEHLIGKRFIDKQSKQWIFVGVLWAEDDFYYLFSNMDGVHRYLTCCISLEQHEMRVI